MYEEFYGLKSKPFSKTPDPAFLYRSRIHEEALARMLYGVEEREVMLLTGEIGSGKTTLSRALIDSLDEEHFRVVLIINPRLTPVQLLKTVAAKIGVEQPARYRHDLVEQINDALYRLYEQDICPVLIIDEAQLLPSKQTFDELRLLTNFQLDDQNLISLILIGQPELLKRLEHKTLQALRQRIGMAYHLGNLDREETGRYLAYRLAVAGRQEPLFEEDAVACIHRYSGGVPRVINNLASNALLAGFGAGARMISARFIEEVAGELGIKKPVETAVREKAMLKRA